MDSSLLELYNVREAFSCFEAVLGSFVISQTAASPALEVILVRRPLLWRLTKDFNFNICAQSDCKLVETLLLWLYNLFQPNKNKPLSEVTCHIIRYVL